MKHCKGTLPPYTLQVAKWSSTPQLSLSAITSDNLSLIFLAHFKRSSAVARKAFQRLIRFSAEKSKGKDSTYNLCFCVLHSSHAHYLPLQKDSPYLLTATIKSCAFQSCPFITCVKWLIIDAIVGSTCYTIKSSMHVAPNSFDTAPWQCCQQHQHAGTYSGPLSHTQLT